MASPISHLWLLLAAFLIIGNHLVSKVNSQRDDWACNILCGTGGPPAVGYRRRGGSNWAGHVITIGTAVLDHYNNQRPSPPPEPSSSSGYNGYGDPWWYG